MVIEVRLLDMTEVAILKVVVVLAVVDPLFSDIKLHDAGQQHGSRVNRKQKAYGNRNNKDRHQVFQPSINMRAVKRPLVVSEVSGVKVLVGQVGEVFLVLSL